MLAAFSKFPHGLQLSAELRHDVLVASSNDFVAWRHPWGSSELRGCDDLTRKILVKACRSSFDEPRLWRMLAEATDATTGAVAHSYAELLWLFDRYHWLFTWHVDDSSGRLFTIDSSAPCRGLAESGTPRVRASGLSRFAMLQSFGAGLSLTSVATAYRIRVHRSTLVEAMFGSTGQAVAALHELPGQDDMPEFFDQVLRRTGFMDGTERPEDFGISRDLLQTMELADLMLHVHSRRGTHDSALGATFAHQHIRPPLPARRTPISPSPVALAKPSAGSVRERSMSLDEALETRRSSREYADDHMPLDVLAEFLYRTARTRRTLPPDPARGMPYEAADRPYPSGGAVHDLELYLIISRLSDVQPGVYHYDGWLHALEPMDTDVEAMRQLLANAAQASASAASPHVLIAITSRFERLSWKYSAIAYATCLKNVGVLFQTMYLVATEMGLASCALGSGDSRLLSSLLALESAAELPVGEFMLGLPRRPRKEEEGVSSLNVAAT